MKCDKAGDEVKQLVEVRALIFILTDLQSDLEGLTLSLKGAWIWKVCLWDWKGPQKDLSLQGAQRVQHRQLVSVSRVKSGFSDKTGSQEVAFTERGSSQFRARILTFTPQSSLLAETKLWTFLAQRAGTWLWPPNLEPVEK